MNEERRRMVANLETLGTLERRLSMSVAVDEVERQVDERLKKLARNVKMPGFRPGKVPVGLLKKQYGQALFGEAVEQAVNSSTSKAIEDRGLRIAMQPRANQAL